MLQVHQLSTPGDFHAYDAWVRAHPQGSLWQSLEWKGYQEALGREVRLYCVEELRTFLATALVVIDRTTFGFSTWEIPRGPLGEITSPQSPITNALLERVVEEAKRDRCMSLYLSPPAPLQATALLRYTPSKRLVMPSATRIIDLTKAEEGILRGMKPKGRYNIHVGQKHEVRVERSEDISAFAVLVKATARRRGFFPPGREQYEAFLHHLPGGFLLLAFLEGQNSPIAGLLGVVWNGTGIYYYGASNPAYGQKMASYLLQWEAMKWCKSQGCSRYDLFGIAPVASSASSDSSTKHPWAGITRFKEQFGGEVVCYPPEQEMILRSMATFMLRMKRKVLLSRLNLRWGVGGEV